MLALTMSMCVACCCIYALMLKFGACADFIVSPSGTLVVPALEPLKTIGTMSGFASGMIWLSAAIMAVLMLLLTALSYIHLEMFGNLAKVWERTRLMFASFNTSSETEQKAVNATSRVRLSVGAGSVHSLFTTDPSLMLPYEKLIKLRYLAYLVALAFGLQCLLLLVVIVATKDLGETHILYTMQVVQVALLGSQTRIVGQHRKAATGAYPHDLSASGTERAVLWHGRMMLFPCWASCATTFVYLSSAFCLVHYYRDASGFIATNSSVVGGSDGHTKCARSLWAAYNAMDSTGGSLLSVGTWTWLLLQLALGALALQHYMLYRETAQRLCAYEAAATRGGGF
jgi:hypothetical protein